MRRLCILLLIFTVVAGCAKKTETTTPPPSSSAKPKSLTKVSFQTDWHAQAEHGGFYQALVKGYYKDVGLDVEIRQGGPNTQVPQRVGLGQADLGMLTSDGVILYAARGLPLVMVAAFMQSDPQAIMVHEESGITDFRQLDGKSIMAVPGSTWIDYLQKRFNIAFKIIPSNFGLAQFLADPDFVQQCFITNEPYYVSQKGAHPRALLISNSGWRPYRGIFSSPEFVKKNPEVVRAFVAASLRGWDDYIKGDPTPAYTRIHELNPDQMTTEFMSYSRNALIENKLILGDPARGDKLGKIDLNRIAEQIKTLVDLKIMDKAMPTESVATVQFLPADLK